LDEHHISTTVYVGILYMSCWTHLYYKNTRMTGDRKRSRERRPEATAFMSSRIPIGLIQSLTFGIPCIESTCYTTLSTGIYDIQSIMKNIG